MSAISLADTVRHIRTGHENCPFRGNQLRGEAGWRACPTCGNRNVRLKVFDCVHYPQGVTVNDCKACHIPADLHVKAATMRGATKFSLLINVYNEGPELRERLKTMFRRWLAVPKERGGHPSDIVVEKIERIATAHDLTDVLDDLEREYAPPPPPRGRDRA